MSTFTLVMLGSTGLWSTEPFDELADRVEVAREAAKFTDDTINPFGGPLVRTMIAYPRPDGSLSDPSPCVFNPLSVTCMYVYHHGEEAA